MPDSIADWGIVGGILAWNALVVGVAIRHALRGRPSWTQRVRAPDVAVKDRITRDWRPLI